MSGKQRKPAIGLHGKLTAEEARQIAKKWIADSNSGKDISAERKQARAATLVKDLAKKYLDDYAACFKKPSSFKSDKSNLNIHGKVLRPIQEVAAARNFTSPPPNP
jgi:hypothetical protein